MLRYLRIASTILSTVACALLLVSWIHSHQSGFAHYGQITATHRFHIKSFNGQFTCAYIRVSQVLLGTQSDIPVDRIKLPAPTVPQYHIDGFRYKIPVMPVQSISTKPVDAPNLGLRVRALRGGGLEVRLPYWFAFSATIAMTALVASPRIRWRFSLRTLLVATTLIAAVLAMIVVAK